MSVRAGRAALAGVLAGMIALSGLVVLAGAAPTPPSGALAAPAVALTGDCPGTLLPHGYAGTTGVANSSFVAMMPINYSYYYQVATSVKGGPPIAALCAERNASLYPNVNGTFSFSILTSGSRVCSPVPGGVQWCNTTTGPYVGVELTPSWPYPTGLEPRVARSGTNFSIEFVRDLTSVGLRPEGPLPVVSPGATAGFQAEPVSALGSPSPVAPTYTWSLTGAGWSLAGNSTGAVANVSAAPGAGPGSLSVVASLLTLTGWAVTPPANLTLTAVGTTIENGSVDRGSVDEGQPVDFNITGTGAAGYAYEVRLAPGLGLPTVTQPCSGANASWDELALSCAVSYSYPTAGLADPNLTLSNGASAASLEVGPVEVAPPPTLWFQPGAPEGYAGSPVPVTVVAGPGTGTPPFEMACFESGAGPAACRTTPGPTWTFAPTYLRPGSYDATAWILDSAGANSSISATVRVVAPLSVALDAPGPGISGGTAVVLAASVAGGLLPARSWWNATGASGPFTVEPVGADGTVTATFLPPDSSGTVEIVLTVVDAAGSLARATEAIPVAAGPATELVAAVQPAAAVPVAGAPVPVSWQALDPAGQPVAGFAAAAEVAMTLAGTDVDVAGWVNSSRAGPLESPIPGWFNVPASAWSNGSLNLTVSAAASGAIDLALTVAGGGYPSAAPVALEIGPDVDHLRLFDPTVVRSGPRSGSALWRVSDRFGDPAPGAAIVVSAAFGRSSSTATVPVEVAGNGTTVTWVNFSAPGGLAGTITVRDLAGDLLLPPVEVPAAAPGPVGPLAIVVALPATALAVGTGLAARSRRRTPAPTAGPPPPVDEEAELRRLAEGRAAAVEIVRRAGPIDLEALAARWDPTPAPADLADWVASLLTDGTLGATFGDDGVARFCLGPEPTGPPLVTFDAATFDRAIQRRDEELAGDDA
jgi:hypothetical protein